MKTIKQIKQIVTQTFPHHNLIELEGGRTQEGNKQAYRFYAKSVEIVSGLPDLLLVSPDQPTFFIEIKTRNDFVSKRQSVVFSILIAGGYNVCIAKESRLGAIEIAPFVPIGLPYESLVDMYSKKRV